MTGTRKEIYAALVALTRAALADTKSSDTTEVYNLEYALEIFEERERNA